MEHQEKSLARVMQAVEAIRQGKMVILVDDESRENEGDLVFAAEHVTPEKINFMVREARGLVCLTLDGEIVDRLQLPLMTDATKRGSHHSTAFTVSIEARRGVSTGISAHDRAETVRVAIATDARPTDLVVPGHIFPLRAKPGGVLERSGHTEGSVDLARLAGLKPAGVICEIMNDDGTMARLPDLEKFARAHDMLIVSIEDLIQFRLLKESLIRLVDQKDLATPAGIFKSYLFGSSLDHYQHLAIVKGEPFLDEPVDVRVHKQRPLVDVLGHERSSGRYLIEYGLEMLRDSEHGVFLYLSHGDADFAKDFLELAAEPVSQEELKARGQYMDDRLYGIGAQILRWLGVKKMVPHLSTPRSLKALGGFGLEVVEIKTIPGRGGI